jgi:1,4-dihydroxy-2-naphthoate octaprenyltransferase
MVKEKLKIWSRAIRLFSLTGSLIPVVLGGVMAMREGSFYIGYLALSLFAMAFLQIGANLISDCDDFVNKVDTKDSLGSSGVIIQGLLKPKQVLLAGIGFLLLGCLVGVFLTFERGFFVLILGLMGALCSYFYSRKPIAFKYRGFGTPLIFIMFGPLPVIGSYYVQTQTFGIEALLISIPTGLLTTAILHANDIRDIVNDCKANIKTFAMIIGSANAKKFYVGLILFAYISVLIMIVFHLLNLWSLIVLITIPIAFKNIRKLYSSGNIGTIDKETALLQMLFGGLLIFSMLL